MLINKVIGGLVVWENVKLRKQLFKIKLFFVLFFCVIFSGKSQGAFNLEIKKRPNFFYNHPNSGGVVEKDHAMARSNSGNSYHFMNLRNSIGAINALVKTTQQDYWIEEQRQIIDNLINAAQVSAHIPNNTTYNDHFKGWVSLNENKNYLEEVSLTEGYIFFYISQFLYILDEIGWVNESNQNSMWWQDTLAFVETNIWTKWYVRSRPVKGNNYWHFLRSRTHMGSHWAGIGMYLGAITNNLEIKSQTETLISQYDTLLKRNLIEVEGGYIWNSSYDDVTGTFASPSTRDIIQDVSHGNHVIAYIVAAHEFGNENWSTQDLQKLANTVKYFMYDSENKQFYDNVDGTADYNRPGWGNSVADGWIKLADYDEGVKAVFTEFEQTNMLRRYNQEFLYKANMYKYKLENDSL